MPVGCAVYLPGLRKGRHDSEGPVSHVPDPDRAPHGD